MIGGDGTLVQIFREIPSAVEQHFKSQAALHNVGSFIAMIVLVGVSGLFYFYGLEF